VGKESNPGQVHSSHDSPEMEALRLRTDSYLGWDYFRTNMRYATIPANDII
jgi:hypothetical protein